MTVRNILFVDDDHEDSEFFSTALRQVNPEINVSVAFNAAEMYQNLDNQVPDLLFIDSFLQEESGQENIQKLKSRPGCQNLTVIMYTGSADTKAVTRAFEAGASAYLVKPNSLQQIKDLVKNLLEIASKGEFSTLKGLYYLDGKFRKPD